MATESPIINFVIENGHCPICGMEFKLQNPYSMDAIQAIEIHMQSYRHLEALKLLQAEAYIPSESHSPSIQSQVSPSTHTVRNEEEKLSDEKQTKLMNQVIIFNFDDTLFPTTKLKDILERTTNCDDDYKYELKPTGQRVLEPMMTIEEKFEFHRISTITYNLLTQYIEQYSEQNICIVTASSPGWIKMALSMVYDIGKYKNIYDLLFDEGISIYHPSCDEFEEMMEMLNISYISALFWKYDTFRSIFQQKAKISEDQIINKFVIIGHSVAEYEAAEKLKESVEKKYGDHENIFIDTIKLDLELTIDGLVKQQLRLTELCEKQYDQKAAKEEDDDDESNDMIDID